MGSEYGEYEEYEFFIGRNMWTDSLILNHHYSHKLPSSVYLVVGIRDKKKKNKILAVCYFSSSGAGRWVESFLELSRLVKLDDFKFELTQLISFGMKQIKKMKEYFLVISYADYSRNHHGGIYQACSWDYHGKRKRRCTGFKIDGEFVHRRTLFTRYGTSSVSLKDKLEKKGHKVQLFYDRGKFLYWKTINKKGNLIAKNMQLEKQPYPKPTKNGKNKTVKEYLEKEVNKKGTLF